MDRGWIEDGSRMDRGWIEDGSRLDRGWIEDGSRLDVALFHEGFWLVCWSVGWLAEQRPTPPFSRQKYLPRKDGIFPGKMVSSPDAAPSSSRWLLIFLQAFNVCTCQEKFCTQLRTTDSWRRIVQGRSAGNCFEITCLSAVLDLDKTELFQTQDKAYSKRKHTFSKDKTKVFQSDNNGDQQPQQHPI